MFMYFLVNLWGVGQTVGPNRKLFFVDPKQAEQFVKYISFLIVKDLSQINEPQSRVMDNTLLGVILYFKIVWLL